MDNNIYLTNHDYIESIKEDLNIKLQNIEKRIKNKAEDKEALEENKENIKEIINKLKEIVEDTSLNAKDLLDKDIIIQLNILSPYLTDSENLHLLNSLKKYQNNEKEERLKKIEKTKKEIIKILKHSKNEKATCLIKKDNNVINNKSETYENIIQIIIENIKKEINNKKIIEYSKNEPIKYIEDEIIKKIESILQDKTIQKTETVEKIEKYFKNIKIAFFVRENHKQALNIIKKLKISIQNDNKEKKNIILKAIDELETKYKKEYEESIKFINNFNFEDIERLLEEKYNKEKQTKEKDWEITECERLSYELEKAKYERNSSIKDIEEALNQISKKENLEANRLELMNALDKGKKRYIDYRNNYLDNTIKNAREEFEKELEKIALQELKQDETNKGFSNKGENFFEDHETIQTKLAKKKEELIKFIEMTPIERGLYDLKRSGSIDKNATEKDLNEIQKQMIPYTYKDESFEYIMKYKEYQKLLSK